MKTQTPQLDKQGNPRWLERYSPKVLQTFQRLGKEAQDLWDVNRTADLARRRHFERAAEALRPVQAECRAMFSMTDQYARELVSDPHEYARLLNWYARAEPGRSLPGDPA